MSALSRGQRAAAEALDEMERVELKLMRLADRCTDAELALRLRQGALAVMNASAVVAEVGRRRGPQAWADETLRPGGPL